VLVPVSRDFLTCVAELTPRGPGREVTVGSQIVAPKKVHDVRPIYPKMAQRDRIQGIVILEGAIAPTGCVTSLSILRSAHRALNFSAVQAVLGWRFTPTLVDGQPVPVIMTVTVNFTLR
jgi:protein TonB